MIHLFLVAAQAVAGLPQISLQATDNGFAIEVSEFDQTQAEAVEAEVGRRAAETCASQTVEWGKFRFDESLGKNLGAEPAKVNAYRREFRCANAAQANFVAAPADWTATAADEADVRTFFETYYARRDADDPRGALAMFRTGMPEDPEEWAKQNRDQIKRLGKGQRRIAAVTWYVNPEAADRPGIYAAIDFTGDYPSVHFYCGYIGLYRKAPGSYEIVREEQNLFEQNQETPDPEQLAQMRAALCRGN